MIGTWNGGLGRRWARLRPAVAGLALSFAVLPASAQPPISAHPVSHPRIDWLFLSALTPTDPVYASQWYLAPAGINAPAAFDITTGSATPQADKLATTAMTLQPMHEQALADRGGDSGNRQGRRA